MCLRFALGTGTFGTRWGYGAELKTARPTLDRFADAGGTNIDTAASDQFGESEENLGRGLAGRRDQFTVATKFAIGGPAPDRCRPPMAVARSSAPARAACVDWAPTTLDLLWVRFPDGISPVCEVVRAFADLGSGG